MKDYFIAVAAFVMIFVAAALAPHYPLWVIPLVGCMFFLVRHFLKFDRIQKQRYADLDAIDGELNIRFDCVLKDSILCLDGASCEDKAAIVEHISSAVKRVGRSPRGVSLITWRRQGLDSVKAAKAIIDRCLSEKMLSARKALGDFETEYALAFRLSDGIDGSAETIINMAAAYCLLQETRAALGERNPDLAISKANEGISQARAATAYLMQFNHR